MGWNPVKAVKKAANSVVKTVTSPAAVLYDKASDVVKKGYDSTIGEVGHGIGDMTKTIGDLMENGASDPLGFMLGSNSKERLARMQEETALLKRRLGSGAIDEENALTKRKRFDPLKAGLASTIATSPLGTGGDLTPSNGGKIKLG